MPHESRKRFVGDINWIRVAVVVNYDLLFSDQLLRVVAFSSISIFNISAFAFRSLGF